MDRADYQFGLVMMEKRFWMFWIIRNVLLGFTLNYKFVVHLMVISIIKFMFGVPVGDDVEVKIAVGKNLVAELCSCITT